MKKTVLMGAALASAISLAGCGETRQDRAVGGAVLGGATGALIGGAVNGTGGAVAGGLIGAAAGGLIGANTAPARRCVRVRYDYNGNPYCTRYVRAY